MSADATLVSLLVDEGLLSTGQAEEALRLQAQKGGFLGEHVVERGWLSWERLVETVARELGLQVATDEEVVVAPRALAARIPVELVLRWRVVPIAAETGILKLALYDPAAVSVIPELAGVATDSIALCVASEPAVETAIARLYPQSRQAPAPHPASSSGEPPPDVPVLLQQRRTRKLGQGLKSAGASHDEIPDRDFATALHLEELDPGPKILTRRKTAPVLLTRRKQRALSVGEVAEQVFAASTLPAMGQAALGFVAGYFPRALVVDLRMSPAPVVAAHGMPALDAIDIAELSGLGARLGKAGSWHGAPPDGPGWRKLYEALGGELPAGVLLLAVRQVGVVRLLVYADTPSVERYDDLHDFERVAHEMGTAIDVLGF